MTPTLIVSLPLEVSLPQWRLFQRVRFQKEIGDELVTFIGLVVGWQYITSEVIEANPKSGFYPRWQYAIQVDENQCTCRVGDVDWFDDFDVLEIVEAIS